MEATNIDKTVFLTGHSVFDQIFYLRRGMTILFSDETFSEARSFLKVVLKNHSTSVVELVSSRYSVTEPNQYRVPTEALQDLSINVNQKRRLDRGKIFIHLYLPELLIRHNPDEVLKVMELWQRGVTNAETIEFYIIPRNTFQDFEKKARAIVDAAIDIQVIRKDGQFLYYFTPMRSCSPQHHLKNIRYEIADSRLLIEWEGALVEAVPSMNVTVDEIRAKIETKGDETVIRLKNIYGERLNVSDYALLLGLDGMRVSTLMHLFPDKTGEVKEKIVKWFMSGLISLEEAKPEKIYKKRTDLKLRNKLLLKLPTSMVISIVSFSKVFLGRRVKTVPYDVFLAVLEAVRSVINLISEKNPEARRELRLATWYFGELSARKTALKYMTLLEGTPDTRFRVQHIPKLISIALNAGWGLDVIFTSRSSEGWLFEIENCHLCEDVTSDEPFCDKFVSSVVSGVLGVCLKRGVECMEITCKAVGSEKCSFRVKLIDDSPKKRKPSSILP